MLSDEQLRALDEDGCVMFESAIDSEWLDQIRAAVELNFAREGLQAGSEFKQEEGCRRLANLVDKDEVFHRLILYAPMLEAVRHVVGTDFKLSSLNARSANPGNDLRQPLHCDMGAVPDDEGYWVCNAIWMLDDFTSENGATRFLPGTHRIGRLPQQDLDCLVADHPDQQLVTGKAGSIAVMNAHVWHGGLENCTEQPRRAVHAFFVRRDHPQQQYQKRLLRPETQAILSDDLRYLLALDDPENDRLSGDPGRTSGFLK